MQVIVGPDAPPPPPAVPRDAPVALETSELKPAWCLLAAPVAVGLSLAGIVVSIEAEGPTATQIVGVFLVALWTAAGVALGVRRRQDRLGPIVLASAIAGGATCLAEALVASARLDGSNDDLAVDRPSSLPRAAPGVRAVHVRGTP